MTLYLESTFKWTVLGLLSLQVLLLFVPWGFAYKGEAEVALNWLGVGSLLGGTTAIVLSSTFSVLYFVIYLGLLFYKIWARFLLLGVCIIGGACIPLYGLSVQSGIEGALGYFITLGEGFLLGIVYFSSICRKFS